jgi:hypothetical protein
MARTQDEHPLDQYIRRVVREELAATFSGICISQEDEAGEPKFTDVPGDADADRAAADRATVAPRRRRRRTNGKGKVSNPSTDRRLKENRDANA